MNALIKKLEAWFNFNYGPLDDSAILSFREILTRAKLSMAKEAGLVEELSGLCLSGECKDRCPLSVCKITEILSRARTRCDGQEGLVEELKTGMVDLFNKCLAYGVEACGDDIEARIKYTLSRYSPKSAQDVNLARPRGVCECADCRALRKEGKPDIEGRKILNAQSPEAQGLREALADIVRIDEKSGKATTPWENGYSTCVSEIKEVLSHHPAPPAPLESLAETANKKGFTVHINGIGGKEFTFQWCITFRDSRDNWIASEEAKTYAECEAKARAHLNGLPDVKEGA